MCKICFLLLLVISFITPSFASERQPLVVLMEKDPFFKIMGANSATFALYDDGLVIYKKEKDSYLSAILSEKEKNDFIASLDGEKNLKEFHLYCEAVTIDDKVENTIYLFKDGQRETARLYANLRSDEKARNHAPKAFLNMFDKIISYNNSKATEWEPAKFQVILMPFGDEKGTPWPEGWPDLKSPETVKKGVSYRLYLDFKYFKELKNLTGESSVFVINGKTLHAFYRFPFPCEEKWI
ncbi:MAG: hypothetical protein ABRQ39_11700 [Candidatus Eremiobacterota bacterium]